jgi:hypothetical protein
MNPIIADEHMGSYNDVMQHRIGSPEWWSLVESRGDVSDKIAAGDYWPALTVVAGQLGLDRHAKEVGELFRSRYGLRAWQRATCYDARIAQAFRVHGRRLHNARIGLGPDSAVPVPDGWELWVLEGPEGRAAVRLIPSEPSPMTLE